MKKFFMTAAAVLAFLTASAQLVTVESVTRVDGVLSEKAAISPDGSFVVTNTAQALKKVNLADGSQATIANGAGLYNFTVSADGNNVVYTRPTYDKKHLRYNALEAVNLSDGSVKTIVKATRKLAHGYAVVGGSVNAQEKSKARAVALGSEKAVKAPFAAINFGHLDVTVNGRTRTIDPQGRGSYIWASVNPAGTRVCYWLVGKGCFTCNLDGSDVKSHGDLRAAVWAGNDMLVGQDEVAGQDQQLKACSIVALDVNTNAVQKLTDDSVIATYPSASADGSRGAFTTPTGEVYIINLRK